MVTRNKNRKRHRETDEGEFVSPEFAEANPLTTVSESVNSNAKAAKFLKKLAEYGGTIVSSKDLSAEEIEKARQQKRMFVDDDGFGYVYQPID
jgi:hypothetical protein